MYLSILLGMLIVSGVSRCSTESLDMITRLRNYNTTLKEDQIINSRAILQECLKLTTDKRQLAYVLSTAIGESNLRPYTEVFVGDDIRIANFQNTYWASGYYGRGYIIFAGKDQYAKFGKLTGLDLINKPETALTPEGAAKIICTGMVKGLFTGQKLGTFFNSNTEDWIGARKIISDAYKAKEYGDRAQSIYQTKGI